MKSLFLLLLAPLFAVSGCRVHPRTGASTLVESPHRPRPAVPVLAVCDPATEADQFLNGRIDPADGVRRLLRVNTDGPPVDSKGSRGAVVAL